MLVGGNAGDAGVLLRGDQLNAVQETVPYEIYPRYTKLCHISRLAERLAEINARDAAQKIEPGAHVEIDHPVVGKITGDVITAVNYGKNGTSDWYIELTSPKWSFVYWKQSIDGGEVRVL
jgi:hypothetical protein